MNQPILEEMEVNVESTHHQQCHWSLLEFCANSRFQLVRVRSSPDIHESLAGWRFQLP